MLNSDCLWSKLSVQSITRFHKHVPPSLQTAPKNSSEVKGAILWLPADLVLESASSQLYSIALINIHQSNLRTTEALRTFVLETSSMANGLARNSSLPKIEKMILMYEVIILFLTQSACHISAKSSKCKN